jgi:hypothetical protein
MLTLRKQIFMVLKRHNDLIEEAIQDLIKKYKNQDAQEVSSSLSVV